MKPSFFHNVDLCSLSMAHRLLFAGMWCYADREGRLVDRAKQLKHDILPFDDCDVEELLVGLVSAGFIIRYGADGKAVIQILNFEKHQNPHPKEAESELPPWQEIAGREISRPATASHEITSAARLFSVSNSISDSVSDSLSPQDGDSKSADAVPEEEPQNLYLEDPIEIFAVQAYRRSGRPRLRLNRKSDAHMVERLQEAEKKHGPEKFRECLLAFVLAEDAWLRENGWPLNRFLQDPDIYHNGRPGPPKPPRIVPKSSGDAVAPITPENSVAAPETAKERDWLAEWNRLVPEQPTEFNSKKQVSLDFERANLEFQEHFDRIVEVSKLVIENKGDGASWLDLYWLCSRGESETRPNWWRLIKGNLRHMAQNNGGKSNIGQKLNGSWKPGMLAETHAQLAECLAWKKARRAAGLHADPDRAAAEGA